MTLRKAALKVGTDSLASSAEEPAAILLVVSAYGDYGSKYAVQGMTAPMHP